MSKVEERTAATQAAKLAGTNRTYVADDGRGAPWRSTIEKRFAAEARDRQRTAGKPLVKSLTRGGRVNDGKAAAEAAKLAGTNRTYVAEAKKLAQEAPKLLDKVRRGDTTIQQAKRELGEQRREAERVTNRQKVSEATTVAQLEGVFSTIMIDPPWDFAEEGDQDVYGRTRPRYAQMTTAEIMELNVGKRAADNAHIYLWITNRSLVTGKGWKLLEWWGFRPITVIT